MFSGETSVQPLSFMSECGSPSVHVTLFSCMFFMMKRARGGMWCIFCFLRQSEKVDDSLRIQSWVSPRSKVGLCEKINETTACVSSGGFFLRSGFVGAKSLFTPPVFQDVLWAFAKPFAGLSL